MGVKAILLLACFLLPSPLFASTPLPSFYLPSLERKKKKKKRRGEKEGKIRRKKERKRNNYAFNLDMFLPLIQIHSLKQMPEKMRGQSTKAA